MVWPNDSHDNKSQSLLPAFKGGPVKVWGNGVILRGKGGSRCYVHPEGKVVPRIRSVWLEFLKLVQDRKPRLRNPQFSLPSAQLLACAWDCLVMSWCNCNAASAAEPQGCLGGADVLPSNVVKQAHRHAEGLKDIFDRHVENFLPRAAAGSPGAKNCFA